MRMRLTKIIGIAWLILATIIFCMNTSFAAVEIFSKFDTIVKIDSNDVVEINKSMSLKNVYDVGIVPGQIEFKVAKGTESNQPVEIEEVRVIDQYGNEIKTKIRKTDDFSIIILDIFYPLLPGFEYSFDLYYRFKYVPGGIFFKSIQIPVRESTIPIEDGRFTVVLPSSYSFTYLSSEGFNEKVNSNVAYWDIKENSPSSVIFEYSYLPVSLGFARGSYIFWIFVNLILLGFLLFEIRKAVKRIRTEYGE